MWVGLVAVVLVVSCTGQGEGEPPSSADRDAIRAVFREGRYSEAEERARENVRATESATGRNSLETAAALDLLLEILDWRRRSDRPEVAEMAERALRIRERRLPRDDPAIAQSLQRLAMVKCENGAFVEARELVERSLEMRRRTVGPRHPDFAASLHGLAAVDLYVGEWDEAYSRLREALGILEEAKGPDSLEVADTLMDLGASAWMRGDLATAQDHIGRALTIRERRLPPTHPKIAGALTNLGVLQFRRGDLEEAQATYRRIFEIHAASPGADRSRLAEAHVNAGTIAEELGDFTAARQELAQALELAEAAHGTDSPRYATILIQAATVDQLTGDLVSARDGLERALEIRESSLGAEHIDVGKCLAALGFLELESGDRETARRRFEQALAIYEEIHLDGSMLTANARAGLGLSLPLPDQAGRARAVLESSAELYEKLYGPHTPELIRPLLGLARITLLSGDAGRAAEAYRDVRERAERYYGAWHPYLLDPMHGEALALAVLGRSSDAMAVSLRAARLAERHIGITASALAERLALAYAAHNRESLSVVLSVLLAKPDRTEDEVREAWDAVVRSRGAVLEEVVSRNRILHGTTDPEIRRMTGNLREIAGRLANVLVRGPEDKPERYRATVDDLVARREEVERRLAVRSRAFRDELERVRTGLDDALGHLPDGAALVAYARFDRHDPRRPASEPVPSLVAFVQPPDGGAALVVDLGPVSEIENAVRGWKTAAVAIPIRAFGNEERLESQYHEAAARLRSMVWDPLQPEIGNARMVFLVPEGPLHLVNFAALPAQGDRYLVEAGPLLHMLTTERDLARVENPDTPACGLLALGGPDFDRSGDGAVASSAETASSRYRSTVSCEEFRRMAFYPLPQSAREAEEIVRLWSMHERATADCPDPVALLRGAEATENAFKQLAPGHAVLHLATHGFFLSDRCEGRAERPPDSLDSTAADPVIDPWSTLSGLVLAGANRRDTSTTSEDDGVLTAGEIALLPLDGVEWVVLSACETGVGDIRTGEGVFGMRRAFRIAGARTLIMSLWQVEDRDARAWMRALYETRLTGGASTAEAVRGATLAMLEDRRREGKNTLPSSWAGFVAAGDWR